MYDEVIRRCRCVFAGKMCSTEVSFLLDAQANFTWGFGKEFFVEADDGKHYIWSSPMYGGDNSFIPTQRITTNGENQTRVVTKGIIASVIIVNRTSKS